MTGISCGFLGTTIMTYLSEIALPQMRGSLLATFSLTFALGQLFCANRPSGSAPTSTDGHRLLSPGRMNAPNGADLLGPELLAAMWSSLEEPGDHAGEGVHRGGVTVAIWGLAKLPDAGDPGNGFQNFGRGLVRFCRGVASPREYTRSNTRWSAYRCGLRQCALPRRTSHTQTGGVSIQISYF
jgi:hypothetical protein